MDDFQDEYDNNDADDNTNNHMTICGLSFANLKTKMSNVLENGKVN